MRNHLLIGLLIIIISILFVSTLTADAENRQQLESKFLADSNFIGKITWWTDDTMKSLDGYFLDLDVYYDDDEYYIEDTMDQIFHLLLPYTGLTESDFYDAEVGYDTYTYHQKLNNIYADGVGFVEIEMNVNDELTITINTLLNVTAPVTPSLTEEQAYAIYQRVCDPSDKVEIMDEAVLRLAYIANPIDLDISTQKPQNLFLTWTAIGKNNKYYIDSLTGTLLKKKANS